MKVKKLKVLGLALCINATLLTGCNNRHRVIVERNNDIGYTTYTTDENNNVVGIDGNVSYDNIDNNIKLVTLEIDNTELNKLMYIQTYEFDAYWKVTDYLDLETGVIIIEYEEKNMNGDIITTYNKGENIAVTNIEPFTTYLLKNNNIKTKYDINELLEVYNNEVVNKTLVK